MAIDLSRPSSRRSKIILVLLGVFCLGGTIGGLGAGIAGKLRIGTSMSFECDRASGQCLRHQRLLEKLLPRKLQLASIQEVAVRCEHVSLSTLVGESQCNLLAIIDGDRPIDLGDWSGDATSESEYRAAATQLGAFLHGTAPTIKVSYTYHPSSKENFQALLGGVFFLVMSLMYGFFLRAVVRGRRSSPHR